MLSPAPAEVAAERTVGLLSDQADRMPAGRIRPLRPSFTRAQWPSYSGWMGRFAVILAVILASAACSRDRQYALEGQILAVNPARQEITVRHGDIKGFMPGMTMPFKVNDPRALDQRKPGELIKATLVVTDSSGRLENIVRTGEAPLPADSGVSTMMPLEPGEAVADANFVDESGRTRRLADWRGQTLAVMFVYTRCPLPDFCPLMDRNFAAVQRQLAEERLAGVRLLSVSFDPDHDSPEVLRAHATTVGSRPEFWTWLTGDRQSIDAFAGQFGVSIMRGDRPMQEITHNLRTVVIDREGRVAKIFNGNDWKPSELMEALHIQHGR
jgi:protein SCO1/2